MVSKVLIALLLLEASVSVGAFLHPLRQSFRLALNVGTGIFDDAASGKAFGATPSNPSSNSPKARPQSTRVESKDVVIVGGGLAGLSAALYLSQMDPNRQITILEREDPSQTLTVVGSFAAAGMLAPQSERLPSGPLLDLCLSSRALYPEFVRLVEKLASFSGDEGKKFLTYGDGTVGYVTSGGFLAPAFAGDTVATWAPPPGSGSAFWLDESQVRELEPNLHPNVVGGWWFPQDASVDARRLTCSLRAACVSQGVQIQTGKDYEVKSLDFADGACHGLYTEDGMYISAKTILLANGAWMRFLLPVPIEPHKGQSISLRMPSDRPPILQRVLFAQDTYICPKADGRIVIGATVEVGSYDADITPAGMIHILQHALDMVPGLKDLPIEETWAGLRPTTPDKGPILGKTSWENLFLAGGYWRNGVLLAPKTGQLIASLIAGNKLTPSDDALLTSFSLERFASVEGAVKLAANTRYAASMHPVQRRSQPLGVGTELGSYSNARNAREEREQDRAALFEMGDDALEQAAQLGVQDGTAFNWGDVTMEKKTLATFRKEQEASRIVDESKNIWPANDKMGSAQISEGMSFTGTTGDDRSRTYQAIQDWRGSPASPGNEIGQGPAEVSIAKELDAMRAAQSLDDTSEMVDFAFDKVDFNQRGSREDEMDAMSAVRRSNLGVSDNFSRQKPAIKKIRIFQEVPPVDRFVSTNAWPTNQDIASLLSSNQSGSTSDKQPLAVVSKSLQASRVAEKASTNSWPTNQYMASLQTSVASPFESKADALPVAQATQPIASNAWPTNQYMSSLQPSKMVDDTKPLQASRITTAWPTNQYMAALQPPVVKLFDSTTNSISVSREEPAVTDIKALEAPPVMERMSTNAWPGNQYMATLQTANMGGATGSRKPFDNVKIPIQGSFTAPAWPTNQYMAALQQSAEKRPDGTTNSIPVAREEPTVSSIVTLEEIPTVMEKSSTNAWPGNQYIATLQTPNMGGATSSKKSFGVVRTSLQTPRVANAWPTNQYMATLESITTTPFDSTAISIPAPRDEPAVTRLKTLEGARPVMATATTNAWPGNQYMATLQMSNMGGTKSPVQVEGAVTKTPQAERASTSAWPTNQDTTSLQTVVATTFEGLDDTISSSTVEDFDIAISPNEDVDLSFIYQAIQGPKSSPIEEPSIGATANDIDQDSVVSTLVEELKSMNVLSSNAFNPLFEPTPAFESFLEQQASKVFGEDDDNFKVLNRFFDQIQDSPATGIDLAVDSRVNGPVPTYPAIKVNGNSKDLNQLYERIQKNKATTVEMGDREEVNRLDPGFRIFYVDDDDERYEVPPFTRPEEMASLVAAKKGMKTVSPTSQFVEEQYNEQTFDGYTTIQQANARSSRQEELDAMKESRRKNRFGGSDQVDESKIGALRGNL